MKNIERQTELTKIFMHQYRNQNKINNYRQTEKKDNIKITSYMQMNTLANIRPPRLHGYATARRNLVISYFEFLFSDSWGYFVSILSKKKKKKKKKKKNK